MLPGLLGLILSLASCARDPDYAKRRDVANADRYAALGRLREAEILYNRALRRDPRFGQAHYKKALVLEKQGLFEDAVASLRRAVELLPEGAERADARVRLGKKLVLYLDQAQSDPGLIEELDQIAADLLKKNLDEFHGRFFKGQVALFQARKLENNSLTRDAVAMLEKAAPEFERALAKVPFHPEATLALARTNWALGKPAAAEMLLRPMLERRPGSVAAWRELYRLLTSQKGRSADAEEALKSAVAANPKDYTLLVTLAEFYEIAGRREEAGRTLAQLKTHAKEYPDAYQKAAQLYLLLGDRETARRQYEEAIRALPEHKLAYQKLLAALYTSAGERDKAMALVEEILKAYPKDIDTLVRRAELKLNAGDAAGALPELQRLVNQAPGHFAAHHNLGRAYLAEGRREDARIHFSEALRLAPWYAPARVQLAEIEFDSGEYLKATLSAEEALKVEPRNARAKLLRAAGLRRLKRFAEARSQIEEVLAVSPGDDLALYQMGELEAEQGKPAAAEEFFRKSYEANPARPAGLMAVVQVNLALGRTARALEVLQQEVRRFPGRKDLRLSLGDTALRLNRCDLALPVYRALASETAADAPALAQIENRLGSCLRLEGSFSEALAHFLKAKQLAPKDSSIHHNLGIVYDQLGRKQEARAAYEASIQLQGNNPVALNNLAFHIAEEGGDLDQALTYAQRARTQSPLILEFADTVGWIYLKKNLPRPAMEIFAELVEKKPDNATFRYHYGAALLKQGDKERAFKELKAALAAGAAVDEKDQIQKLIGGRTL